MGAFILIDKISNFTVGAGMVRKANLTHQIEPVSKNISYFKTQLYRWVNSFDTHARKEISEADMDWNQEVVRLLSSMPLKRVMRVFQGTFPYPIIRFLLYTGR